MAEPICVSRPAADAVLRRGGGSAHVFNLGHGVLPETDPEVLERLVEHVHGWRPDSADASAPEEEATS